MQRLVPITLRVTLLPPPPPHEGPATFRTEVRGVHHVDGQEIEITDHGLLARILSLASDLCLAQVSMAYTTEDHIVAARLIPPRNVKVKH